MVSPSCSSAILTPPSQCPILEWILDQGEKAMKDILRGNWRNLNGECLLDNIVSMLNLSDVIMALWFFWRMCDKVFKCLGVYSVLAYGSTK